VPCGPGERLRLWAAHLERDIDDVAGDPSTVEELWRPIATEQRERKNRGEPLTQGLGAASDVTTFRAAARPVAGASR